MSSTALLMTAEARAFYRQPCIYSPVFAAVVRPVVGLIDLVVVRRRRAALIRLAGLDIAPASVAATRASACGVKLPSYPNIIERRHSSSPAGRIASLA